MVITFLCPSNGGNDVTDTINFASVAVTKYPFLYTVTMSIYVRERRKFKEKV
jgi:hypothetical protein